MKGRTRRKPGPIFEPEQSAALVVHLIEGFHMLDQQLAVLVVPGGNGFEAFDHGLAVFMATTGQSPTRALSIPKRSSPHQLASPKACLPEPPSFMAARTASGSTDPAFSAPAFQRSMIEAYSQETAPHSPG